MRQQNGADSAGLTVAVKESYLPVEPGAEGELVAEVTNLGSRVDEVQLSVELAYDGRVVRSFAEPTPAVLNLYPQAKGEVVVRFAPRRDSTVVAGTYEWRLHADSTVREEASRVATGTVRVGSFSSVSGELSPELTTGRRRQFQHSVALRNSGNTPWSAGMKAVNTQRLTFQVPRDPIVVAPGQVNTVSLSGVARRRWFGRVEPLPLRVDLESGPGSDSPPVHLVGTRVQRPLFPAWLLSALAVLLALGIAAYGVFGRPDTSVEVPAVDGKTVAEATALLEDSGFDVTVQEVVDDAAEGTAIKTTPAAGEAIEQGSPVTLYVSLGPEAVKEQVKIPTVQGLPAADAQAGLESLGLVVRVVEEASDLAPAGQALRTDPASNTMVDPGASVALVVSTGPVPSPAPSQVVVPAVPGVPTGPTLPSVPLSLSNPTRLSRSETSNNWTVSSAERGTWCGSAPPTAVVGTAGSPAGVTATGFLDGDEGLVVQITTTNNGSTMSDVSILTPEVTVVRNGVVVGRAYELNHSYDLAAWPSGSPLQLEMALGPCTCVNVPGEIWPAGTYEVYVSQGMSIPDQRGYPGGREDTNGGGPWTFTIG